LFECSLVATEISSHSRAQGIKWSNLPNESGNKIRERVHLADSIQFVTQVRLVTRVYEPGCPQQPKTVEPIYSVFQTFT